MLISPAELEAANRAPLGQRRLHSFLEATTSTAVGFAISWALLSFIISPLFSLHTSGGEDFLITCIFTVASILRSYLVRRVFNHLHQHQHQRSPR